MTRLLSRLAALALVGSAAFFSAGVAHADWDWDGIGTGSVGLVRPTNAASVELQKCDDGKVATWKKSRLTYSISNSLGLDLYLVDSVRSGVQVWNNVASPYSLTEVRSGGDITIEVVPLVGLTKLGGANVICKKG